MGTKMDRQTRVNPAELSDEELVKLTWGKTRVPRQLQKEVVRRFLEALRSDGPFDFLASILEVGGRLNAERNLDSRGRPIRHGKNRKL